MTLLGDLNTVPQRNASSESVQLLLVLHPSEDYVLVGRTMLKTNMFCAQLAACLSRSIVGSLNVACFPLVHCDTFGGCCFFFQTRQVTW